MVENMFRAKVDPSILQQALGAATVLVSEAKVHFNQDGMTIRTVDPANVGMIDLSLTPSAFQEFTSYNTRISVDIERIEEIASKARDGQLLEMSMDIENRDLEMKLDGYKFDLSLIDSESVHSGKDPSTLDPDSVIQIKGSELMRAVDMAGMFSDQVVFAVDGEKQEFSVNAIGDNNEMRVTLTDEELVGGEFSKAKSIYSIQYLRDMGSAIPKDSVVDLGIGTEYPLMMEFSIADGQGTVTYGLAPRIR